MAGTCALSASLILTGVAGSISNDGIRYEIGCIFNWSMRSHLKGYVCMARAPAHEVKMPNAESYLSLIWLIRTPSILELSWMLISEGYLQVLMPIIEDKPHESSLRWGLLS